MQQLVLADELWLDAVFGKKFITIRKGVRDIVKGPLRLEQLTTKDGTTVNVTSAYVIPFQEIPLRHINMDGAADHEHMLEILQQFYPDMTMHTECTVVIWERI